MIINSGFIVRGATVTALLGLAACARGGDIPAKSSRQVVPSIIVGAQSAADQSVTIKRAEIADAGFVVIHEIVDGKPVVPQSVGHASLNKGLNVRVKIQLSKAVAPGSKLLAMLHSDSGKIGTYEFNAGSTDVDTPVVYDGKPVVKPFAVQ